MKKVLIASENPVKIEAARNAFTQVFPSENFEFEGVKVESSVREQPLTLEETIQGAHNRIEFIKENETSDFYVAQEAGVFEINGRLGATAWFVVENKEKVRGEAQAGTFFLPPELEKMLREGQEMGPAAAIVFGESERNVKQQEGAVGLLTHNLITRTDYYVHPLILALIPFKHDILYKK